MLLEHAGTSILYTTGVKLSMLFHLFIITLFAAWGITTLVMAEKVIAPVVMERILSKQEHELVKKYAAMFGLDNEAHDLDVNELIEIGRKYEEYLGSDVIISIAEQHVNHHRYTMHSNIARHMNARRHHVNQVINERNILTHITCLAHTVFIQIITGGNKDGEPSTSNN